MWGDFREKLKIARTSQKVIWSRRLTPAVNEKWEFAGNVQFVDGCALVLVRLGTLVRL
jgi:hypothetical protein